MRTKGESQLASRNLASGARDTIGAAWVAATRHARALVRAVLRTLAWGGAVRGLGKLSDGTLRDIGVSRDRIPDLVRHWLDEGGLGIATTKAPRPPSVQRRRVDVRGGLTAALLGDTDALPPTGGEREAKRADLPGHPGMVHPSRMEA